MNFDRSFLEMNYSNQVLCGPMVRISSLPFRLLALEYGADLVFSEELIDYRLIQCVRVENGMKISTLFLTVDDSSCRSIQYC